MSRTTRVLLLDLLVERSEFGHGGNQEVIQPLASAGDIDVFLLTPHMQSEESGVRAFEEGLLYIGEKDVPNWDHDYPFWDSCEVPMEGNIARFHRVAFPTVREDLEMAKWLECIEVDAVVCSGSRKNVTMWEEWMYGASSLMRVSSMSGIPTLGICFGHQLLCKSLGAEVTRAESMSSGVWNMKLSDEGHKDILFDLCKVEHVGPAVVYSHQDHVVTMPENSVLLGSASHNEITAIRVLGASGDKLPAWGVQFHPEAAKHRIERAFQWGHMSENEMLSLQRDHDGAGVLESFANVVLARTT